MYENECNREMYFWKLFIIINLSTFALFDKNQFYNDRFHKEKIRS